MRGIVIIGSGMATSIAESVLKDKGINVIVAPSINDLETRLTTEAYAPYVDEVTQLSHPNIKCGKELRRERRKKMRK